MKLNHRRFEEALGFHHYVGKHYDPTLALGRMLDIGLCSRVRDLKQMRSIKVA